MKKKILMLVLCAVMLLSCIMIGTSATTETTGTATTETTGTKTTVDYEKLITEAKEAGGTDYTSKTTYPFAMFVKAAGADESEYAFLRGFKRWTKADTATGENLVMSYLSTDAGIKATSGKDVYVLLRSNFTKTDQHNSDLFKSECASLTLDLGGYSINTKNYMFYYDLTISGEASTQQAEKGISFTIKNGTIPSSKSIFYICRPDVAGEVKTGKSIDVLFDNVSFNGFTANYVFFIKNEQGTLKPPTGVESFEVSVTYKNCVRGNSEAELYGYTSANSLQGITLTAKCEHGNYTNGVCNLCGYCDHSARAENGLCPGCGDCLHTGFESDRLCDGCGKFISDDSILKEVSVSITKSFALNFITSIPAEQKDDYTYELDGKAVEPTIKDGVVVFTYTGIGPQNITENITLSISKGEAKWSEDSYSIMQYCQEAFEIEWAKGESKNVAFLELLRSILSYARFTEIYESGVTVETFSTFMKDNGYGHDVKYDPVNYDLTDVNNPIKDSYNVSSDLKIVGNNDETLKVYSANLYFGHIENTQLVFKIKAAEAPTGVTLKKGDGEAVAVTPVQEDEYYVVYIDVSYNDLETKYTITLSNGTSVTYSAQTYIYNTAVNGSYLDGIDDGSLENFATTFYNYAKCCEAYAATITE